LGCTFAEVTVDDLKHYVAKVNGSDLEAWTKRDYRLFVKKFFGWLRDPAFVAWIKLGKVKASVGPEDILDLLRDSDFTA